MRDDRCKHGMFSEQCAYCKGYGVSDYGSSGASFAKHKVPIDYRLKTISAARLAAIADKVKKRM